MGRVVVVSFAAASLFDEVGRHTNHCNDFGISTFSFCFFFSISVGAIFKYNCDCLTSCLLSLVQVIEPLQHLHSCPANAYNKEVGDETFYLLLPKKKIWPIWRYVGVFRFTGSSFHQSNCVQYYRFYWLQIFCSQQKFYFGRMYS